MKFLILTNYGSRIIEAEDFDDAVDNACDNHTGYDDVNAIIKLPNDQFAKSILREYELRGGGIGRRLTVRMDNSPQ